MMKAGTGARWWFDPRFAIGLTLVVASVLGVLWLVASSDSSVHVYSARAALSPGDRIHRSDLVDERVRLPGLGSRYLTVADVPQEGLIVTRVVSAGELVPSTAVGSAAGVRVTSVVVTITGELARSIDSGAVVDLWSAVATTNGAFGPPTVLVSSATVVRLVKGDSVIAADGSNSVELLVPRSSTARVLEAVANRDAVSLVPASLPIGG